MNSVFLLCDNLQTLELSTARILDKLRQSPFSVKELAFDRQEWLNS